MTFASKNFTAEMIKNITWLKIAGVVLIGSALILFSLLHFYSGNFSFCAAIVLFVDSFILFIHAFRFYYHKTLGFLLYILIGLVYLLFAATLFWQWFLRLYLVVLLIFIYALSGIFNVYVGSSHVRSRSGWGLIILSGVIDIFLAFLLYANIDKMNLSMMIFTMVLNLFFIGYALIGLSFGAKKLQMHHKSKK